MRYWLLKVAVYWIAMIGYILINSLSDISYSVSWKLDFRFLNSDDVLIVDAKL